MVEPVALDGAEVYGVKGCQASLYCTGSHQLLVSPDKLVHQAYCDATEELHILKSVASDMK